ncbi:LacI family DNA-binding transcriptional regulator [Metabacillus arenae]|uniref:LacI family DNA-binding transcriptional regulator n=1 Tax=Metabacillus arenae TaxID=2771434 RepID=A0A926RY41_9BACI|nr:LacI family DNA-binding transcriptional regulator [Metabacillus arenae]MBD1382548.1 LacI family DNA-binding transcriptional regulator [Metabacillus arenae]
MNITIKDIAREAGVSYSTVSKALNDSPLVKPDTKIKIVKLAKEMGYEPNFAAQRLVSKQSKTIGLIWPSIERVALSTLITNINEKITENSYSMILSINSIKASLEMFRRFQVDGVIVFEENNTLTKSELHHLTSIPTVSYGVPGNDVFPVIDVNWQQALYDAVYYLYNLGHRKITYIGDFSPTDPRQMEKYDGFKLAFKELNLPMNDHSVINTGGLDWYDGYVATTRLLQSSTRPSAIIGSSYDISSGIIRALREAKILIPKEVSVLGYDNIPQMGTLETPLTSVGVPVEKIASTIVQSLMKLIVDKESIPSVQTLTPELTERISCAQTIGK